MKPWMMFCYMVFLGGLALQLAMDGQVFTESDISILNAITGLSGQTLQILTGIPIVGPVVTFFTSLFYMLTWQYSYLDNAWGFYLKIPLYAVSYGVVFGIVEMFQGAWQGIVGVARTLIH